MQDVPEAQTTASPATAHVRNYFTYKVFLSSLYFLRKHFCLENTTEGKDYRSMKENLIYKFAHIYIFKNHSFYSGCK